MSGSIPPPRGGRTRRGRMIPACVQQSLSSTMSDPLKRYHKKTSTVTRPVVSCVNTTARATRPARPDTTTVSDSSTATITSLIGSPSLATPEAGAPRSAETTQSCTNSPATDIIDMILNDLEGLPSTETTQWSTNFPAIDTNIFGEIEGLPSTGTTQWSTNFPAIDTNIFGEIEGLPSTGTTQWSTNFPATDTNIFSELEGLSSMETTQWSTNFPATGKNIFNEQEGNKCGGAQYQRPTFPFDVQLRS